MRSPEVESYDFASEERFAEFRSRTEDPELFFVKPFLRTPDVESYDFISEKRFVEKRASKPKDNRSNIRGASSGSIQTKINQSFKTKPRAKIQYQIAKVNRKSTADRKSPNSTRRDAGRVRSVSETRYERLGEWFNPSLNYIKYVLGIIASIIFSGIKYRVFDGRGRLLTRTVDVPCVSGFRSQRSLPRAPNELFLLFSQ